MLSKLRSVASKAKLLIESCFCLIVSKFKCCNTHIHVHADKIFEKKIYKKQKSTASLRKLYTVADSSTFLQVVVIIFFQKKDGIKFKLKLFWIIRS